MNLLLVIISQFYQKLEEKNSSKEVEKTQVKVQCGISLESFSYGVGFSLINFYFPLSRKDSHWNLSDHNVHYAKVLELLVLFLYSSF